MLVFALLLIFSTLIHAEIQVAILDTGFCDHHDKNKLIFINPSIDLTDSSIKLKCNSESMKLPRFHGELVLSTFIKNYGGNEKIVISPFILYDNRGEIKSKYWKNALSKINEGKFNFVISAVGVSDNLLQIKEDHIVWLLSAPRVSPFIKITDSIFPQNQFKNSNVFLIGNYNAPNFVDQGLLYKNEIDLFVLDVNKNFNGSSYSVAFISPLIITKCNKATDIKNCIKNLKEEFIYRP